MPAVFRQRDNIAATCSPTDRPGKRDLADIAKVRYLRTRGRLDMNTSSGDNPLFTAKLCSAATKRKVAYAVLDNSIFLFVEKKDILLNQLAACERLLPYAVEEGDRTAVLKEIDELRAALDLMN